MSTPEDIKRYRKNFLSEKGIAPEAAHNMAQRLLSDKQTALETLAREELGIDPQELGGSALEAAITSFLLFSMGAVIPVFPYIFFSGIEGIIAVSHPAHLVCSS